MATFHTPPIDLYAESTEGFGEEHRRDRELEDGAWHTRPADNGEPDEPAIDAGEGRLKQVLGW